MVPKAVAIMVVVMLRIGAVAPRRGNAQHKAVDKLLV